MSCRPRPRRRASLMPHDDGEGANGVEGGAGRRRGASDTGIPLAILTCLWCIGLPRASVLSRGLTLHHSCSRRERAWERSTPTARAPCTVRRGRAMCRRCRLFAVPCEPTCAPSSAHYDAHLCAALIGDQSGRVCAAQRRRDAGGSRTQTRRSCWSGRPKQTRAIGGK